MRQKLYDFLVNRHIGIRERYHAFHDGASGGKAYLSWVYLLWLNACYYLFFCRFLGKKAELAIYEEKRLPVKRSESQLFRAQTAVEVSAFVREALRYDAVSFDIFDTLILRPFSDPTDLFYVVGERLGVLDFKHLRTQAERKARKRRFAADGHYEVTLREIWKLLEAELGISADVGMQTELDVERQLCYANPFMTETFRAVRDAGKRIVIISDMYLPREFLCELLEKNGFTGFDRIYVSCEYRKNKGTGDLFDLAVRDAALPASRVHVGDNPVGDVASAKKHGFASLYYPNVNRNSVRYRTYDISPLIGSAYRGTVNNRLYNGLEVYDQNYEYGYVYGGLFVLGYAAFIHRYCRENHVDGVLFLSRDGDIVKQVYDRLFPQNRTEYVYWSRRVATKLTAEVNKHDFFEQFIGNKVNQGFPVREIFSSMELDALYAQCPDALKTAVLTDKNAAAVRAFLDAHWQEVLDVYAAERQRAKRYFEDVLKGCRRVVAVDIGWAGRGAIALRTLTERLWQLPCEVIGIVAGTNTPFNVAPDASEAFLQAGTLVSYLYSSAHNRDLWKKHDPNVNYNVYWELLLSSPTPQFRGFGENGLVFGKNDVDPDGSRAVQRGILDFAEDYSSRFAQFPYMFNVSGRDAYAPMLTAASRKECYLKRIARHFSVEIHVS